ncbi:MAG: DUF262 domain-containing protein [Acetobacterium sp.]|uniref:DUF262 domain-containing protein n=1 Tax=Acetobacterium malicum TaxID=52692 RepID=A0ABR6Z242_9FIRM|nr:DUF262 domain-containing protein [Acetobacterium malicum]MBC3901441.1 DUF262 domain-containing protein [Acetobacterium malicum]MBU4440242.1 DUF262 domain-containing protein [Bacillota bacterium]MCG2729349.1 DUF262 domain-containing protein [Acetobacterium sp.]
MTTCLKLAITKIGDILLHDKITLDNEGKSINNINLVIPNYQRPYKWTAKNVIQLLEDIIEARNENKETYRVGTLILHQEGETYNIVDGQQRTITFSLLLKAFGADSISFLEQPLVNNSYNTRNIANNYRTLDRRAKNIADKRDRNDLLEYIKNNCELIVVITQNLSEAFQFFDSQNARGKKLYPHDLLKAYHLREMNDLDVEETEKVVKGWEDLDQKELSSLFSDYLYRVKEWTKGNKAWELTEHNIHKFKGITRQDNFPYAQFYKGAFAYADTVNHSAMPFVSGIRNLKPFQLVTPIVAGKPFFDYTKHYFEILKDIKNNDKYEGHFINDNDIVKTLDLRTYRNGVGNRITRLLFDTAILLYVDRFCPERPVKIDLEMLDQFVVFAFIWAYSLRAQYTNLGWQSAQNYILGNDITNAFNIYKIIIEADSPVSLLSELSDSVNPLNKNIKAKTDNIGEVENGIHQNYLYYFKEYNFLEDKNEN